jgi:septal ring factor EnvC (AmiA/AmiB activator)
LDKHDELDALSSKIEQLEETLSSTRGLKQEAEQELETLERKVGALTRDLLGLDQEIADLNDVLANLRVALEAKTGDLRLQQQILRRHLHAAYVMGREERLKLLLSQEEPGTVSRVLAYYEYLSKARARRIASIRERMAELYSMQQEIGRQQEQLGVLREQRRSDREQFMVLRLRREALIEELGRSLTGQDEQLRTLKRDAERLQQVVEQLDKVAEQAEAEKSKPIKARRGSLAWPLKGRLISRFGSRRAASGLTWDGVVIGAPEGAPVKAVYHGRVAFADWLRGFGLLLILDHGDGYMSLYGFNQTLLKETGEWVDEGEAIALVGDSGGRNHAGLYFAIRHRARPHNPRNWCQRLRGSRTG